jgi:queuine/archaeosine tRNA-ribosyltransferase
MGGLTLPGRHKQKHQYRRLTVPELEVYLRQGCSCSVCEYVRAEIHALQKEVPNPGGKTNGAGKSSRYAD